MRRTRRTATSVICLVLAALCLVGCSTELSSSNGQTAALTTTAATTAAATAVTSAAAATSSAVTTASAGSTSAADAAAEPIEQLEMLRMGEGGTDFPTPWLRGKKGGGSRKHMLIFDSLLEKDDEGLIPWLAESYEIEDDGVTYLFTLRNDILWHDGEKMTAEDVAFTFEYCAKHTPVSSSLDFEDIASVEAVDELTVKIVTKEACATLLENIGKVSIIPKHIWEKVEDPTTYEEDDALVGSGPYILAERKVSESVMIYTANENFWGPTPAAKSLYWMNVSDDVLALEADEIELARGLSAEQVVSFKSKPEFTVENGPAFSGSRLLFNMDSNALLATKEMRQAIYYAFDSQEMLDKLASGIGEISNAGILPPAHIMYNPDVKQYVHNLDKADELLDALGYSEVGSDGIRVNSKGERLSFKLLSSGADSSKLFIEQMERAGIEFVATVTESATAEQMVADAEYEVAIVGHAGLGGDADYLRERYAGGDLGASTTELSSKGYNNQEVISLLKEQRTIIDFDARKEMLYKIQELMAEDVVEIMLYYGYDMTAWRPEVWDGWNYCYDERNYLGSKMSYLFYDQWKEALK